MKPLVCNAPSRQTAEFMDPMEFNIDQTLVLNKVHCHIAGKQNIYTLIVHVFLPCFQYSSAPPSLKGPLWPECEQLSCTFGEGIPERLTPVCLY